MMERIHQWYARLTWRDVATKGLLALTVLVYPFNNFPVGPFTKLTFYPLLALLLLNWDRLLTTIKEHCYLRYVAVAGGCWAIWMVLSLCFAIGPSSIGFAHVKAIAGAVRFFVLWYTFIACCLLFSRDELRTLFYWTFIGLLGYCTLYSLVEWLHFNGVAWATWFLEHAIHCFIHTGITEWTNGNVWPPVLWDSERFRSVFEEPAYYSVLLGFSTLFFALFAWVAKGAWRTLGNLFLAGVAAFLLCKTRSAAGAISLAVASGVWILLALCQFFKMNRVMRWKMGLLAFIFLLGPFFALMMQRHSSTNVGSLMQAVVAQDTHAVTAKTTRSIHLFAELTCIADSPIYGHGMGEYDPVMRAVLEREPYKTHELSVWLKRDGAVPWLNWFSGLAVMYGLVGLALFLAWFAFPLAIMWIKQVMHSPAERICASAALGLFLACQMMSANTEIFCYMLLMTFPVLCIYDARNVQPENLE